MQPFFEMITNWRLQRAERRSQVTLSFGEQDPMDFLSYAGMEEQPDYLVIDGQYLRTLYVSGYPFVATSGWLHSLINFSHNADVSYHLMAVNAAQALPKLNRKITELESTRRAMIRSGKIVGPETSDPLESASELRDKILRGQEKLFQVSIYVCLTAASRLELNKVTALLETELAARLFYTKAARYQQPAGLQSVLPRGQNQLNQRRNLDSSSAALTFPLISSELVQGTRVIVIDPEREYKLLAESVNGSYIKLSMKSREKINPFDMASTARGKDDVAEHAQDLTEVISLMAEGLNSSEKAAVDKAIWAIYRQAGKLTPLLQDLSAQLRQMGFLILAERLEKYLTGTLAGVFNEQTNVSLDNRLVVFDIKDMPESLRQIMMMIISNFVSNQVKAHPAKRLLVIDEGWMLLEHEQSARFVTALVRRARKYYLGVSIISQQANDFLRSDYGRAIASQSSLRILMKQDTTTIRGVALEFNLSEWEENFLLTCGRGDALVIADQNHAALRVVASAKEHPLITTNPAELYRR